MRFGTKYIAKAALIAAIYAAVTFMLAPISFGAIQFRISEALTLLPMLMPEAVPGLFVGCLIANIIGGGVIADVIAGSLATLGAALVTRKLRHKTFAAAISPVIFNMALTAPAVYFCYVMKDNFSLGALLATCITVGLGEAAVVFAPGLMMMKALKKAFPRGNCN